MLRSIVVIGLLLMHGLALAEDGVEDPSFAMPAIGRDCGTAKLTVLRDRVNTVLSVVRGSADGQSKPFVAVGPGSAPRVSAVCCLDVRLERPLVEPRTLALDFHGLERKGAGTVTRLSVAFGTQRHLFQHARGSQLDELSGKSLKRFLLVDLPVGTRHVKVSIAGKAERLGKSDEASLGFDALDFCFVSPEEQPEFCGAPGFPNPRAAP